MEAAIKIALSSMISTAHANLSVGPPYDLGVYRNGSLEVDETRDRGRLAVPRVARATSGWNTSSTPSTSCPRSRVTDRPSRRASR